MTARPAGSAPSTTAAAPVAGQRFVAATIAASAEWHGLRRGLRRAWRWQVPPPALAALRDDARAHGLSLVVVGDIGAPGGDGRGASESPAVWAVIGCDDDTAQEVVAAERQAAAAPARLTARVLHDIAAAHHRLGDAFGYPVCCVDAFTDAHVETLSGLAPRDGDNFVAIARAAARSARFDPLLDTLTSGLGVPQGTPLRHLPCRFDCPPSLALAERLRPHDDADGPLPGSVAHATDALLFDDGAIVRVVWEEGARGSFAASGEARASVVATLPGARGRTGLPPPGRWSLRRVSGGLMWRNATTTAQWQARCPAVHDAWRRLLPIELPFASSDS